MLQQQAECGDDVRWRRVLIAKQQQGGDGGGGRAGDILDVQSTDRAFSAIHCSLAETRLTLSLTRSL